VSADRDQLRQTFNTGAELYDRARPSYPAPRQAIKTI
jgi:hypothetical protein